MTEEETEMSNQIIEYYNKYKDVQRNQRPHITKTNISKIQKDQIKKNKHNPSLANPTMSQLNRDQRPDICCSHNN